MIKRILTICAAVTAGAVGTAFAQAQSYPVQSYPPPPGQGYSPYPPNGAPADYRRAPGVPDFDSLDDEEEQQGSTVAVAARSGAVARRSALWPPDGRAGLFGPHRADGPVLSPDDPRYGRPMDAPPAYSDRTAPTGPVMSPDDPRYGRPSGPPAGDLFGSGNNPAPGNNDGMRPPEAVDGNGPAATGSVEAPVGADGKSVTGRAAGR